MIAGGLAMDSTFVLCYTEGTKESHRAGQTAGDTSEPEKEANCD